MTLTAPKAALAGVMPNTSFKIFMASIAAFNEERVASGRFGRCDFVLMVKTRDDWEKRRSAQAVGDLNPINLDERPCCRTFAPEAPHRNGAKGLKGIIVRPTDQFFVDRPRTIHPDVPVAGSS